MDKKKKQVKIYWQPEWATSIVYWSYTLLLGCLALIIQLELIRLNLYTVILGFTSLIFFIIGTQRYLVVMDDQIKTFPVLKKNIETIKLSQVKRIECANLAVTITKADDATITVLMLKKQQVKFLEALNCQTKFQGQINIKDMG